MQEMRRPGQFGGRMSTYRIPLMDIQDTLFDMKSHPGVEALKLFCNTHIHKPDCQFKIDFELERQWYPVVVTNDRWLATMVMKEFVAR
jgi:hypothetical protein